MRSLIAATLAGAAFVATPVLAQDQSTYPAPAETTTSRARPVTEEEVFGSSSKTRHGDDEDDLDLTSVFSNMRGGRHDDDEE